MKTWNALEIVKSADLNGNFDELNQVKKAALLGLANFAVQGATISTSATLTATLAAGVVYVNGKYISISSQSITFAASKDTYVDIKDDGTIVLVPVANGATTGMLLTTNSDSSDAYRLGKVVSSASAVTGVTQNGFDSLGNVLANKNPHGFTKVFFPTYQNSWVDYDTTTHGPAYYAKNKAGFVEIGGLIKNGTTTAGTVLFNLPSGYRPPIKLIFSSLAVNAVCNIAVNTAGDVLADNGANATWTSLSNIRFTAF